MAESTARDKVLWSVYVKYINHEDFSEMFCE